MRHVVVPVSPRFIACVLACLALLQPSPAAAAAPCWRLPVSGWVTDPFREPSCPYCSGNRGIEFRVGNAANVRAVAAGEVTYSGSIAGVRYVVVEHGNGWKITYGRLESTTLQHGDRVVARSLIGTASTTFYFGLRIGGAYRDPAPYLGRRVGRARLVPVDGTPRRPVPPARWQCG